MNNDREKSANSLYPKVERGGESIAIMSHKTSFDRQPVVSFRRGKISAKASNIRILSSNVRSVKREEPFGKARKTRAHFFYSSMFT